MAPLGPLRQSLVLGTILVAAAPVAVAQDKDDLTASELAQAEDLFEQGQVLYKAGKYAQALVSFLDSYDIYPADELLYNIAFCYEKLDQDAKALEYYESYLETLPEDAEKERADIMARIEVIEGGGEDGEGDDEADAPPKKSFKEKIAGEYRGSWVHGLWAVLAMDFVFERGGVYPSSDRAGLGIKAAYNARLMEQRLSLALELGYLSLGYYDDHAWSIVLCPSAGYRVGLWRGGSLQLYAGGAVDLKYFRTRTFIKYGTVGVGAFLRLFWHWGEKVGLFFEAMPVLGVSPRPVTGYVYGYLALKLGFVFGIR